MPLPDLVQRRPRPRAGLLALVALAACGAGAPASEVPRLASSREVDPLLLERLEPALAAAERAEPGALLELAKLYDANGQPELALRAYDLAALRDPPADDAGRSRLQYHRARVLETLGRTEDAAQAFQAVLARVEDYAPAHWRLGQLWLDSGALDGAEREFGRALELEPSGVSQRLGLARVHLLRGRPADAVQTLQPVIERDKRERYAHGLLARAYRALGDETRAAVELRREERATRSTVIDPWTAEVQQRTTGVSSGIERAQELLRIDDALGALRILEPLHQRRPDALAVTPTLALALLAAGELERAGELLDSERSQHPDQFQLELLTGRVLHAKKLLPEARQHLLRARELNPAYGPTHSELGEVEATLGLLGEAEQSLTRAREIDAELRASLLLGEVQTRLEAHERALATYERACRDFPHSAAAWTALGEYQARHGNAPAARLALAEAERRDPEYARLDRLRELLSGEAEVPR